MEGDHHEVQVTTPAHEFITVASDRQIRS
jgi:hypothetical protein